MTVKSRDKKLHDNSKEIGEKSEGTSKDDNYGIKIFIITYYKTQHIQLFQLT